MERRGQHNWQGEEEEEEREERSSCAATNRGV